MKRSRFTETQIISILSEVDAGLSVKEVSRKHGISDASLQPWHFASSRKSSWLLLVGPHPANQRIFVW